MNYKSIKCEIKSGEERLTFEQNDMPFKLLDFWKWSFSDLISNTTRGIFAEFIVATATGVDLNVPRDAWASYDLTTSDNIKIEVKSASFIQSWFQKKLSIISFSIKKSFNWDGSTGNQSKIKSRSSDVYVMCLLFTKKQESINPLNIDHWKFYVLSTQEVSSYERSQTSITLKSLEKLTKPVSYSQLNKKIKEAYKNTRTQYNDAQV